MNIIKIIKTKAPNKTPWLAKYDLEKIYLRNIRQRDQTM